MVEGRMTRAARTAVALAVTLLGPASALVVAQDSVDVPLAERHRGAERVVVGRVASVTGVWRQNEFGDRLIYSLVRVTVDETLKGQAQQSVDVEVEGGTIGDLTLRVSDMTTFKTGDRAVFYLKRSPRGALVPHLRGQGLLKLDANDRVIGSAATLTQVRRAAGQRNQ
jgi:hypothetical protein